MIIQQICKQFLAIAFPNLRCKDDPYYKEWEQRFEIGMEWQKSDIRNRTILQNIAPDIYPTNTNLFFIRE